MEGGSKRRDSRGRDRKYLKQDEGNQGVERKWSKGGKVGKVWRGK